MVLEMANWIASKSAMASVCVDEINIVHVAWHSKKEKPHGISKAHVISHGWIVI